MSGVQVKKCNKCGIEKDISLFSRDKGRKDGLQLKCKQCNHQYRLDNSESVLAYDKKYKEENKEKINDRCRAYHHANKARLNEVSKKYYKNNSERLNKKNRKYAIDNIDRISVYLKKYREDNLDGLMQQQQEYYKINREKIILNTKAYRYKRIKNDPVFALRCRVGSMVMQAIRDKGYTKKSRTHEILGCDYKFLYEYLEMQFLDGMSWSNRSEWHIDHIIPLASAKSEDDVLRLNHYGNLRPLWASENMKKRDKMPSKELQDMVHKIYIESKTTFITHRRDDGAILFNGSPIKYE